MPGFPTRSVAGMAALALGLALQACSAIDEVTKPPPPAAPAPSQTATAAAPAQWSQSLDFSGDLGGHMSTIVPNDADRRSECTGKSSKTAGAWASTLYGQAGADGKVYGVILAISGYRGPGVYREGVVTVQVHAVSGGRDWQSRAGDQVTVTIGNDEESGSMDATLTSAADGRSKVKLTGSWTCHTA